MANSKMSIVFNTDVENLTPKIKELEHHLLRVKDLIKEINGTPISIQIETKKT